MSEELAPMNEIEEVIEMEVDCLLEGLEEEEYETDEEDEERGVQIEHERQTHNESDKIDEAWGVDSAYGTEIWILFWTW